LHYRFTGFVQRPFRGKTTQMQQCPICKNTEIRLEKVFGPAYRECPACGFLWRIDRENFPNPNQAYQETEEYIQILVDQETENTRKAYYRNHLERLHRYRQPPGKLLELGCGTGGLSKAALDAGWEVLAVDSSHPLCRLAEKRLGKDRVLEASVETKVPGAGEFDAVVSIDLLEHIPDTGVVLKTAHSALKAKGILILQTPNARALRRYLQGSNWNLLKPQMHFLFHTRTSLHKLLQQEGFRVLSVQTLSGTGTAGPARRTFVAVYGTILSWLDRGNALYVVAEKAE
jgi:2-polyprenyl-3-methyl-5-hydroxy-6-metoxy-1,4-benzoquinol methylase